MSQVGPRDALSKNLMKLGLLVASQKTCTDRPTRFMFYTYRFVALIHVPHCTLQVAKIKSFCVIFGPREGSVKIIQDLCFADVRSHAKPAFYKTKQKYRSMFFQYNVVFIVSF